MLISFHKFCSLCMIILQQSSWNRAWLQCFSILSVSKLGPRILIFTSLRIGLGFRSVYMHVICPAFFVSWLFQSFLLSKRVFRQAISNTKVTICCRQWRSKFAAFVSLPGGMVTKLPGNAPGDAQLSQLVWTFCPLHFYSGGFNLILLL